MEKKNLLSHYGIEILDSLVEGIFIIDKDFRNVYVNKVATEIIKYEGKLAQNVSGSPLCHVSVSQWCNLAEKKVHDVERKERCARLPVAFILPD